MNGLLIVFLFLQYISIIDAFYDCPRPLCEICLPAQIHDAPGIGFDLTPSYGTASVHYYNGTVVELAYIHGNPEYLELMMRLAGDPRPRLDRTKKFLYDTILPRFSLSDTTSWGACWRWLNKKLGRPIKAYSDVEIISKLLQELKVSTEKEISQPLDRVAVATPDISSISSIVNAALEDLDLRTWVGDSGFYPQRLVEADAVYAANGYGLCANYEDLWECTDEFYNSPNAHVFYVFYSRHLLYTSIIAPINGEALSRFNTDEAQVLDFEVGLDNLVQTDESQGTPWSRLRSQLLALPREYPYPLTHILLAGESATHPRFLATLRDALSEMVHMSPVNLQTHFRDHADAAIVPRIINPIFVASRGAALYARRRQEVQAHCTEPYECEAIRKRERVRLL
ncbi:hypothetical protein DTO166G4_7233 [Paecilomyces variotii]|uniref:Uncharacterized protein n=1 Tax=Byssochlamys spectabilis TaxID=264951 RepID=A0A443HJ97_BYSSP|nr:hypothetical protein C8Q69DRAFT_423412 [Paecilomyces variotii]KAJ9211207.1 hypothetical protein DTO166G4_7233 [Paecilomyces variotii]KAJ9221632.1 hypothetical protein DTO169C6_5957 [Paecilomyces variotii]KAJ9231318.1 hypothetical protein DTO166G5_6797 [Paecilomyces variotii]KAJ9256287.1 hypothetical protein DTO195F2_6012 [Paecilomyces variotii]KAJ9329838.1 hypothetical protein DTO027B3_325 [Paecilomyces variotii]